MTIGKFNLLLHRKYSKGSKTAAMSRRDRPWLSMIDYAQEGGSDYNDAVVLHGGRGWAGSREQAQAVSDTDAGNGGFGEWRNTPGEYKGSMRVKDRFIRASAGGKFDAYGRAFNTQHENYLSEFGGIISRMVMGPPGMYVASGTISSGVITLDSASTFRVSELQRGDQLVASADDFSSSSHATLGSNSIGYVKSRTLSGSTKTVTVSATPGGPAATPAGWTGTIYIYRNGEQGGGIDDGSGTHVIDSYQKWVEATEPTGTYKNVDRGTDGLLAGARLTSAQIVGLEIEEILEQLSDDGRAMYGWTGTKYYFVHTKQFRQISRNLERRRFRQGTGGAVVEKREGKAFASFSYNAISLAALSGAYEIVDDPHMPVDYAMCMNPEDWEFRSYQGGMPSIVEENGNRLFLKATSDDYEVRHTFYGSFKLKEGRSIAQSGRAALPALPAGS